MGYLGLREWLGKEGKGMGKRWALQTVVSITAIFVGLSAFLILPQEGVAQKSFFEGKTIRIIGGFSPGGGIDIRSRLFPRHIANFIPGKPTIIVQSMSGAGGIVAANYTFGGVAKPDGLSILHFPSSTIMNAFLLKERVKYDLRKVPILWVMSDSWVTITNPKMSKLKTAKDILESSSQLAIGGTGATSLRTLRPKLAMVLLGVDHRWVTGYRGSSGLMAAMDRGELDLSEQSMASYKTLIQPREKDGTAAILFQTGLLQRDGSFERARRISNIPTLADLLPKGKKTGAVWEAWKAASAPQAFQSVVGLPPGVSSERVAILRKAFKSVTEDPAFRADFKKTMGIPADAIVGKKAASVVDSGLKQLFNEFREGVEYLRGLPKRK